MNNFKPTFNTGDSFTPKFSSNGGQFNKDVESVPVNITSDKSYIFKQKSPAAIWEVSHDLDKYPAVTVVDSGNNIVIGDVNYIDKSHLTITFTGAFSGTVYLN